MRNYRKLQKMHTIVDKIRKAKESSKKESKRRPEDTSSDSASISYSAEGSEDENKASELSNQSSSSHS